MNLGAPLINGMVAGIKIKDEGAEDLLLPMMSVSASLPTVCVFSFYFFFFLLFTCEVDGWMA